MSPLQYTCLQTEQKRGVYFSYQKNDQAEKNNYLFFFFDAAPLIKSQKECETILTPSVEDELLLQPLVVEDWPKVPVSEARPLSCHTKIKDWLIARVVGSAFDKFSKSATTFSIFFLIKSLKDSNLSIPRISILQRSCLLHRFNHLMSEWWAQHYLFTIKWF